MHGAAGRMGRSILGVLRDHEDARVAAALEHAESPLLGEDVGVVAGGLPVGLEVTSNVEAAVAACDVVIDFSVPEATERVLRACAAQGRPAVVGTTGLTDEGRRAVQALAEQVAVVQAPNFSQGVTLLFHLAALATERLGARFDAEIVEMHHRHKVDAPSGTALRLGEVVARARGLDPDRALVKQREGQVGPRTDDEVGVMTLRGGDVVGEHTLVLAGAGERLELTHRATDRSIFARGAVRAAVWATSQGPGLYDMADVMGIPR
ncbi:MAG: 4-hydroxy-tetrahydrodipicolinate reductase [Myxococcota bacterium]